MSVAVGRVEGQLHGFWIVVWNVQSEKAHALLHPRFWMVRVAVGQASASGAWARTRLARPRRAERASFILGCLRAEDCLLAFPLHTAELGCGVQPYLVTQKLMGKVRLGMPDTVACSTRCRLAILLPSGTGALGYYMPKTGERRHRPFPLLLLASKLVL
jgi:hypothetical protein